MRSNVSASASKTISLLISKLSVIMYLHQPSFLHCYNYSNNPRRFPISLECNFCFLLRLSILFRIEIQQGSEQGEDHRTENDSERAEERQPAENAEKEKQHRQSEPIADDQGLENIVHCADDAQGPDQQHDGSKRFALKKQVNGCRDGDEGRAADRQERDKRRDYTPQNGERHA